MFPELSFEILYIISFFSCLVAIVTMRQDLGFSCLMTVEARLGDVLVFPEILMEVISKLLFVT